MPTSENQPRFEPPVYVCEQCDGGLIPIVYGFPGPELFEAAERGDVILGGCMFMDDAPQGRCRECGAETHWLQGRRLLTSWQHLYEATGARNDTTLEGWLDDHCELDGCWVKHEEYGPVVGVGGIAYELPFPYVLQEFVYWTAQLDFDPESLGDDVRRGRRSLPARPLPA